MVVNWSSTLISKLPRYCFSSFSLVIYWENTTRNNLRKKVCSVPFQLRPWENSYFLKVRMGEIFSIKKEKHIL